MAVAAGPDSYTVELVEDASAFLAAVEHHLALDPVVSTVVTTVAQRTVAVQAASTEPPQHPRWFAVVRDIAGAVSGVAMRTAPFPPHPLFLLPMGEDAALALARALHERAEPVHGANGALPATRVFAEEVGRLSGGTARIDEHTRLFELDELVEPPPPPGRLREARDGDADLVLGWFNAFGADAAEQAGRKGRRPTFHTPEDVAERIEDGRVWIWEDESSVPVHLTGHSLPAYGVSRIGPVYTPREHRGRGYASAAVGQVSRMLRDGGARVCLFTDQANPTSNGIYQVLGYRPVVDMANLLIS